MKPITFSLFALCSLAACTTTPVDSTASDDRTPIGKADQTGSCQVEDENFCGGQSDGNCWCDDSCEDFGDCCSDKPVVCDGEEPAFCAEGTIQTTTRFFSAADDKECSVDELHCVTNDFGGCPQLAPLPPDFCEDGEIVSGEDFYVTAADGMECAMPSVHCVTHDFGACPQLAPLPPDFCSDGVLVTGPPSFISSADGMECAMPNVHCLTNDAEACEADEPEFCEGGTIVAETVFEPGEAFECQAEQLHCVTNDGSACPQLAPLPPDFCEAGDIVHGPAHYITSADGMECALPSVHCVTRDGFACPQLSPLPPNFCEGGEVVAGESSFVPSADGMECQLPSVHCVAECA